MIFIETTGKGDFKMLNQIASMPIMVKTYAKKFGVIIRIQGSTAYTNGKVITIPRLDVTDPIKARLAYGYLAHEASHVRNTNFDILRKKEFKDNLCLFSLFNILEDCRIEKIIASEFIGVFENLELLSEYYKKEWNDFINCSKSVPTLNLVLAFIQVYGQCVFQRFEGSKTKARKLYFIVKKRFSEINKIATLVKESSNALSSDDIYKICKKIFKILSSYEYQDMSNDNFRNYQDENYRNILDESTKLINRNFKKVSNSFVDEYSKMRIYSNDDESQITPNKNSAEIIQENSNSKTSSSREDFGVIEDVRATKGREDFIEKVKDNYALRSTIHKKLSSYVEKLKELNQSGKKLNITKAQKLPLGETDIFYRTGKDVGYSTSVQVLVDVSSSMLTSDGLQNSRCEEACISALTIAMALEAIDGIKTAVHYFPGQCCEYETALEFGERASRNAPYFDQKPRGSTPLAQALYCAFEKASEANCNRNVIIVITDGMPDSVNNVKNCFNLAKELGIEIYGISIRSEMILKLFEKATIVDNATELNKAFLSIFNEVFDISKIENL